MIEGLSITPEFLSEAEQGAFLAKARGLSFRVHGEKHEAVFWSPGHESFARQYPPIPDWALSLAARLCFGEPYRLIVSDYAPGRGMGSHRDMTMPFLITGSVVSLLSDCEWVFSKGSIKIPVKVPARSLLTFSGPARYEWQHEVRGIKERRVSLYFSFKETD
jgi:alkylated DNA repair dioxygenase AlkB